MLKRWLWHWVSCCILTLGLHRPLYFITKDSMVLLSMQVSFKNMSYLCVVDQYIWNSSDLHAHVHNLIIRWFILAGPMNSVFKNVSTLSYSNFIGCSFLNNQSFYCVVCCSTDPSVPPDSSVYNISTTRGTEVTVFLQGLTNGQIYYCKAAATNTSSAHFAGPVVGDVKMYFNFVASTTFSTTCKCMHTWELQYVASL